MNKTYTFTFTEAECATLWSALLCGIAGREGKAYTIGKSLRDAQDMKALKEVFDTQHHEQWYKYKNAQWLPQESSNTASAN